MGNVHTGKITCPLILDYHKDERIKSWVRKKEQVVEEELLSENIIKDKTNCECHGNYEFGEKKTKISLEGYWYGSSCYGCNITFNDHNLEDNDIQYIKGKFEMKD